jgi:hypothetical protein
LYAATLDATTDMEQFEHVAFKINKHLPSKDDLLTNETKQGNECEDFSTLFEPTDAFKRHLPESPEFEREENLKDLTPPDIRETLPSPINVIPDDEHIAAIDDQAELLRWHYRLGHQSFKLIKLLAALKILPR